MTNISNDAQNIIKFHQELKSSFEETNIEGVKAKFSMAMTAQHAFFAELREDLIPVLSNICEDECLIIDLWVKDALVFDGDYRKSKLSSVVEKDNVNQCLSNALINIKGMYANLIPVLFIFRESFGQSDYLSFGFDLIEKPFTWGKEDKKSPSPKIVKPKEKDLEKELLDWLFSYGIQADSQVKTSKHRTDIWIPSKCFLELKRDKVTGDDVCQAIDYCVEYKMPIIIVGNNITEMACRGITAFNKAVDADLICFVQWSAIKVYLKGMFGLR
jgi:hypothetical protein